MNKTNYKSKQQTRSKRYKKNEINPIIIISAFILLAGIITYILLGKIFAILVIIGIIGIIIASKIVNIITKNGKRRKLMNFLIILFLITCILGVVGVGGFFIYIANKAPDFDPEKLVYSESTIVYDSKGAKIAELGSNKRENITYDQMSEVLIDAIVATEDSRFFQHNGFDAARFIKASAGQAVGQSDAGGASTLSMQVIKNSFTSTESKGLTGIIRKFTDIYLSVFKLEKQYTKQQIIEFYANNHFLGSNSYGVEQAAKTYFGKHASELNLAEASLIVGLFKAPTSYNPYSYPEQATKRRGTVLNLMYKHGYITKEEKDLADSIPISSLLIENKSEESEYQGYIDTVVSEIEKKYNINPYSTAMLIYTNMDSKKQSSLNKVYTDKSYKWANSYAQAGIAAVDADTGKIIAIGAGRNRNGVNTYNYATDINRQIGSTSKPVIDYAPGMEYLNWSTYTIFSDTKYYYSNGQEMRDSDRSYMGNITLRTSIAQSRNIPALKAFQQVKKEIGEKKYKEFINSFGIQTEDPLHEAHSVGAFNGSNPLTMAAAYAVFANGGYYYEPYTVNKIVYRNTGEVIEYESEGKRIISDSTAFMITDSLVTAVQSGLSSAAKINGYNIAAKTGTTNYDATARKKLNIPSSAIPDAWIIGYDANTVVSVWYGCEKVDSKHYISQSNGASQRKKLFRAAAKIMFTKGTKFKVPSSVVKVGVEKGSNPAKLASSSTPSSKVIYEYFKKGTEPTETSVKYSSLKNVTGLNAYYNSNNETMNLSWNATSSSASSDDISQYGELGYKIYKDNTFIAFTTNTSYTINNVTNPEGKYKIITSHKNYSDNASSGTTYTYKVNSEKKEYSSELKRSSMNYSINEDMPSYDKNPSSSDIRVYLNGSNITSNANIDITITNSNGETFTSIDSSIEGTYTITYIINIDTYTKTLKRTITIS